MYESAALCQEPLIDAESRLVSVDGGATASYVYDAEGRRVEKTIAGGSVDYLYDLSGHQIAEVNSSGALNRGEVYAGGRHLATYLPSATYFNHSDWLGTERLRTDISGVACETITSLPFGDGQGTSGSCNDASPLHFTGKERDSETQLDYFGARYYSNGLGRFITPDPLLNSGRPWDPQTWNRYGYAHNNPLSYVDPSGLYDWQANAGGSATDDDLKKKSQDKDASRKDRNAAKNALKFRDKFRAALATATAAAASTGDSGALAAYGTEGDHNGVNVGTQLGSGAGTILNQDNTISVNFGKDLGGNNLAVTVAHEGQHVEDGQAWVAAGHPSLGSPLDMNHYERETRAWGVSARIAQALGMSHYGPPGGGSDYYVWNSSWHNIDRVNAAIGKVVHDLYHESPGDTDRYSRENLPPVGLEFFDRH